LAHGPATSNIEPLAASVQAALHAAVADQAPLDASFQRSAERARWLSEMSQRLAKRIPDESYRSELLRAVHYEATRAGLDPQLVLGLIQVESGFKKYAVSSVGARGYMQVMPFWAGSSAPKTPTSFTCAPTCASDARSCATTLTSRRAISSAPSVATTGASARPSTQTWCAPPGSATGPTPSYRLAQSP
jgi:hypothetical protein